MLLLCLLSLCPSQKPVCNRPKVEAYLYHTAAVIEVSAPDELPVPPGKPVPALATGFLYIVPGPPYTWEIALPNRTVRRRYLAPGGKALSWNASMVLAVEEAKKLLLEYVEVN